MTYNPRPSRSVVRKWMRIVRMMMMMRTMMMMMMTVMTMRVKSRKKTKAARRDPILSEKSVQQQDGILLHQFQVPSSLSSFSFCIST